MVLPLWRSNYSLNLMLPKEDRRAMLLRLYNDDSPLTDHSKDRFNNKSDNSAASGPLAPESGPVISDEAAEAIAEKETEEKLAVATARDDTNLQSEDEDDDDDDDDDEGGVAIGTAGLTAQPTGLGSGGGEGSGAAVEQYGSSTGVDNVRE